MVAGGRVLAESSGSGWDFVLWDLISPRLRADSTTGLTSRRAHFPFGEGDEFSTYLRDGESPDYAWVRFYQPTAGRFLSPDPFLGFPNNPKSRNRYSYGMNDPINLHDPTGAVVRKAKDPCSTAFDGENGAKPDAEAQSSPCGEAPVPPENVKHFDHAFGGSIAKVNSNIDLVLAIRDVFGGLAARGFVVAMVWGDSKWDYKSEREGRPDFRSTQHFGNFNFGAVARSAGFSPYETAAGAGVASTVSNLVGAILAGEGDLFPGEGRPPFWYGPSDFGVWPYGDINTENTALYAIWGFAYAEWYICVKGNPTASSRY